MTNFDVEFVQDKKTKSKIWPQLLAVITASIFAISLGQHYAWSSPAMPVLFSDDSHLNITSDEASYIIIVQPLGDFIGAPTAAILADIIGRKKGLIMLAIPTFTAWLFIAFAQNTLMFCIGRFISGIGDGFLFIMYPMYIGEVTEPRIRGVLGCSLSVAMIAGSISINSYAPFLSIQNSALVSAMFPLIGIVCFIWMPESPYFLLMKGRIDEARKSLVYLRRCDVEHELQLLNKDVQRQISERGKVQDLFCIDSNRKALFITFGIRSAQQFSGISAWSLFTQTIFIQAGAGSPLISTLIYLFAQLGMTVCGSLLVDKFGRKPLLIFSSIAVGLVLNIGGIYFYLKEMTDFDTSPISWVPIAVMIAYIMCFSIGLGTVPSLMLSEMFSASIKGKALCVMSIYYAAMVSLTSKLFHFLTETYGMYVSFFTFGISCFVSVLFSYYFVPETKGKSLEEIQQHLKGNYVKK